MTIFNDTSSGGAVFGGCASVSYVKTYITEFGSGDIVYSLPKARKGILEKVVIKKTSTVNSKFTQGAFRVLYVDTLNSLWNERDLTSHANAISLAKAYYENLLEQWEEANPC